jgi:DNA polymerase (family 10)
MDNFQIADVFSLLSKLMDIHGENGFKAKSYAAAAFAIEKLSTQLLDYPKEKIAALQGIGTSTAQKIIELIETGKLNALENLLANTPAGIVEMLQIKGIGPKKIHTIWKEMELETIGELLYACKENRLKLYKGFGEKTQQNVIQSIEFYFANKGSFLYAQVLPIATELQSFLTQAFPNNRIAIIGAIKRQLETIDQIEFLVDTDIDAIFQTLQN